METIIAAIISGIATIVAAWISRKDRKPKPVTTLPQNEQPNVTMEKKVVSEGSKSNTVWWTIVISVFAIFIIFAGIFIHHDLPSMLGLVGIPVVVIILALAVPAKPWTAAAFTFGVSTIAFLTEFVIKVVNGNSITLASGDKWLPFWIVLFSALYASLGAVICWWRRKKLIH